MIAAIHPDIRTALSDESLADVVHAVDSGVQCSVCEMPVRPENEAKANVIALREELSGRLAIRYAHCDCAPSALIDVARIVEQPAPLPADEDSRRGDLAWALSTRTPLVPTVVLVWDVDLVNELEVGGRVLLDALRLEGFRGGVPLDRVNPPARSVISAERGEGQLSLITPYGCEPLIGGELGAIEPLLHVAARQRELLLVIGERLCLGDADLDEAERRLEFGEALAARISYHDPELAAVPLYPRAGRLTRRLLALAPSARAQKRALRHARARARDPMQDGL